MWLSKEQKILNVLLKAKGKTVHMRELVAIAYRYGARIYDLRHKKGYDIKDMQISKGEWVYWIPALKRKSS
jgi:hypothetical protein